MVSDPQLSNHPSNRSKGSKRGSKLRSVAPLCTIRAQELRGLVLARQALGSEVRKNRLAILGPYDKGRPGNSAMLGFDMSGTSAVMVHGTSRIMAQGITSTGAGWRWACNVGSSRGEELVLRSVPRSRKVSRRPCKAKLEPFGRKIRPRQHNPSRRDSPIACAGLASKDIVQKINLFGTPRSNLGDRTCPHLEATRTSAGQ